MPYKDPEARKKYLANYHQNRKKSGICVDCGVKLSLGGSHRCMACITRRRENRLDHKASGLCSYCSCQNKPVAGRSMCDRHNKRFAKYRAKKTAQRLEQGLCPGCGQDKPLPGKKSCNICYVRYRARLQKIREIVFNHYGGPVCVCCGETNRLFLTIDHIHGGGNKHRKQRRSQLVPWLYYHNLPGGYQVLCFNCNCGRARSGGVCPHKLTPEEITKFVTKEDHTSHLSKTSVKSANILE